MNTEGMEGQRGYKVATLGRSLIPRAPHPARWGGRRRCWHLPYRMAAPLMPVATLRSDVAVGGTGLETGVAADCYVG